MTTTNTAGTPNTWAMTLPWNLTLTNGATYFVVSRATDSAGNAEFGVSTAPVERFRIYAPAADHP